MKSMGLKFSSVFGVLVAVGLVADAAIFSSDAEAICLGKKCRERKAQKLSGKAQSACEQDPNSKACVRITNRLDRVLGRKNMAGYVQKHGLNTGQVSLASQLVRKRWCEMKGLTQASACQAAYNARNAPGGYAPVGSGGLGGGQGSGSSTAPQFGTHSDGARNYAGQK